MNFYVYVHRKITDGCIFYVGKGSGNRAWFKHNRSDLWSRIVRKHGFYVEIIEQGLQEWYAFELESLLICYYGRLNNKTGILANLTDGGEGVSGCVFSEESCLKISKSLKDSKATSRLNNARSDKNTYTFYNYWTKETFTGTRCDFEDIKKIAVRDIFKGKCVYTVCGWCLIENKHLKPKYDPRTKLFKNNKTGEEFTGTYLDFKTRFKLDIGRVAGRKCFKTYYDWTIINHDVKPSG